MEENNAKTITLLPPCYYAANYDAFFYSQRKHSPRMNLNRGDEIQYYRSIEFFDRRFLSFELIKVRKVRFVRS